MSVPEVSESIGNLSEFMHKLEQNRFTGMTRFTMENSDTKWDLSWLFGAPFAIYGIGEVGEQAFASLLAAGQGRLNVVTFPRQELPKESNLEGRLNELLESYRVDGGEGGNDAFAWPDLPEIRLDEDTRLGVMMMDAQAQEQLDEVSETASVWLGESVPEMATEDLEPVTEAEMPVGDYNPFWETESEVDEEFSPEAEETAEPEAEPIALVALEPVTALPYTLGDASRIPEFTAGGNGTQWIPVSSGLDSLLPMVGGDEYRWNGLKADFVDIDLLLAHLVREGFTGFVTGIGNAGNIRLVLLRGEVLGTQFGHEFRYSDSSEEFLRQVKAGEKPFGVRNANRGSAADALEWLTGDSETLLRNIAAPEIPWGVIRAYLQRRGVSGFLHLIDPMGREAAFHLRPGLEALLYADRISDIWLRDPGIRVNFCVMSSTFDPLSDPWAEFAEQLEGEWQTPHASE